MHLSEGSLDVVYYFLIFLKRVHQAGLYVSDNIQLSCSWFNDGKFPKLSVAVVLFEICAQIANHQMLFFIHSLFFTLAEKKVNELNIKEKICRFFIFLILYIRLQWSLHFHSVRQSVSPGL